MAVRKKSKSQSKKRVAKDELNEVLADPIGVDIIKQTAKQTKLEKKKKSFVIPTDDDGAVVVEGTGAYSTYVDLDGAIRNEFELVTRYRDMAGQPECNWAIDNVVNEAIIDDKNIPAVAINLEGVEDLSAQTKNKIKEEFDGVLRLLDFKNIGYDVFRKWYIDGRLYYHVVFEEGQEKKGIAELRYIDPRQIRKVREVTFDRSPEGVDIVSKIEDYFVYNPRGWVVTGNAPPTSMDGIKIKPDSVIFAHSGQLDKRSKLVTSYLHQAIKSLNQLRMIEDAVVIYRIARAPERRIFYIDVGNMPKSKAEEYLKQIMTRYKNKMVYDASTGEIRDDRRHMSMLEDFWLPRREGSQGTQIETLPAGQNLSEMQDVEYFQKALYRALNVPFSRWQQGTGFDMGRANEITRDELAFHKFIIRLQKRFNHVFNSVLSKQLVIKGIITAEEWDEIQDGICYDYASDSYFTESKNTEILKSRMDVVNAIRADIGVFFSKNYVRTKILMQTEDEIEQMEEEIKKDQKEGLKQTAKELEVQQGVDAKFDPKASEGVEDINNGSEDKDKPKKKDKKDE